MIRILLVLFSFITLTASAAERISGAQARELIRAEGAVLVDVRSPDEFRERHLAGAMHFPLPTLSIDLYHFGAFDRPIVVYCRSGRRSAEAAGILEHAGYSRVYDLGPIGAWDN
ncbi:MAG: hypothetical protein A2X94_04065 [Bdellovibrionales bacterium GWB1_55_8]|nr:MAG: hypothetical protein A2X94_04065 [Bdellovibrionales bacterium GWB1_55_8]